jgi:hypothetical protein
VNPYSEPGRDEPLTFLTQPSFVTRITPFASEIRSSSQID